MSPLNEVGFDIIGIITVSWIFFYSGTHRICH